MTVVGLTSTLIYTIGVLDIGYPQMIATYTYTSYGMSTLQAADITSVFWGCYAAGRLLAIFIARKFQLIQLIVLDLFLEMSAGLIFTTLSRENVVYLHLANAILGFGTAAIYPLTINWLRRHINLTNKTIGAVFLLESFSEMTLPIILAQALTVNHDSLAYFMIASPVSYALMFALQYAFTYWYQNKHNILQHAPTDRERLWMGPLVPKFFVKKPTEKKPESAQVQQEKTMDIFHELDVLKERVQNKTAGIIRSLRTLESTGIRVPSGNPCVE
ncbi:sodium-dependent glucose transporter 1B-like [Stegodyphus dumicola]|uniref:sodium-dependent glucose transporter 1B-like n=1 Tax=Stegodyphus dumicola TaxID=202533 RepID=UPI0015AE0870|nr:sodium-dependent glucose transporter 1B-like [Stegodyphus dumicola]